MTTTLSRTEALPSVVANPARPGWAERLVRSRLRGLQSGRLTVESAGGAERFGSEGDLDVRIRVHDARFWGLLLRRGSIGAAEAYMQGLWTSDDLPGVVRLMVRNREALEGLEGGLALVSRPFLKLWHAARDNTKSGSRRNISAHYDLSNEFFALLLDETMTYSCGFFEREEATLAEASLAKIDRLCDKLELSPTDHLLEIGTGWGAFAIRAASEYGCRVTTTTISREQHDLAAERIRAAGLEDRITLLLEDYRNLEGRFDKLVSVEMIEAVGHRHYDAFFETCSRLLVPGGRMALQAITIADQHYEQAKNRVDFIQRYVFPGSCIPSVTALISSMTRAGDLRLYQHEDITEHYVPTLAAWRRNLFAHQDEVRALGKGDEFLRLWDFYLCYCEGGFAERHIGDVQMLLAKPGFRPAPAPVTAVG